MNINRNDYEEYLLMYADNELTATETNAVKLFLQSNPDIAIEFNTILQTKLPKRKVVFNNKNLLLKITNIEREQLLNCLDAELTNDNINATLQLIESNRALKIEWDNLQKTKLPYEQIVFEQKDCLYKKEKRKIIHLKWWKIAAAIFLLLCSSYYLLNMNSPKIIESENLKKADSKMIMMPSNQTKLENKKIEKVIVPAFVFSSKKNTSNPISSATKFSNIKISTKNTNPIVAENSITFSKKDFSRKIFQENNPTVTMQMPDIKKIVINEIATATNQPEPTELRINLNNNTIQTMAYTQPSSLEENSDNQIFYTKESVIKKSLLGSFVKKISNKINRLPKLKTSGSIKIANLEFTTL